MGFNSGFKGLKWFRGSRVWYVYGIHVAEDKVSVREFREQGDDPWSFSSADESCAHQWLSALERRPSAVNIAKPFHVSVSTWGTIRVWLRVRGAQHVLRNWCEVRLLNNETTRAATGLRRWSQKQICCFVLEPSAGVCQPTIRYLNIMPRNKFLLALFNLPPSCSIK